ncbi:hypothetical protein DFJ73DRAFT_106368 [Zopfochytrium polystomum]|nr:hypothetical protein DFJ73DRAFT_106368 [Zopfochytrium polystomum]
MTVLMALSLFAAIQFEWPLAFGSFDWALWALTLGIPLIGVVISSALDAFGPDLYFCLLDTSSETPIRILAFMGSVATFCLILPVILYLLILKKVRDVRSEAAKMRARSNNDLHVGTEDKVKKAVIVKTARYVSIILATFAPTAMFCATAGIFRSEDFGFVLALICFINAGGAINCIAFLHQRHLERTSSTRKASNKTSNKTSTSEDDIAKVKSQEGLRGLSASRGC